MKGARIRLWMKLAALAAGGVVLMHAAHLAFALRISSRTLAREHELLGMTVARLVAERATDPVLLDDRVSVYEVLQGGVAAGGGRVRYCFVVRDGQVLASTFQGATPPALVGLRGPGEVAPILVHSDDRRTLDVVSPILGGELGEVRVGVDMGVLRETRRRAARDLGLLAVALIALGVAAAFVAGRHFARPIGALVEAADAFDPTRTQRPRLPRGGSDELAELAARFDRMMQRLEGAHAEQQRSRQKEVETERLVALGALVGGVAHEVNNPLAGLKNCLRRLELGDLPEEKRREYLELMSEGLDRIEDVVKRLLDFGRPLPPVLQTLPASRLAQDTAHLVEPALERRRIDVRVEVKDEAFVRADRRKLTQALVNLLLNAAYVTPEGGEIRLGVLRRDGRAGLAVWDRGPGIPPDIRDRVLDPFFSTKPEGEGTGLGLSVTRTIVDAHGGELTFDFPTSGGTVATIWLPVADAPARRGES